jgi:hypothetical protein
MIEQRAVDVATAANQHPGDSMTPTTTGTPISRGLGILGIATLALVTLGTGAFAQSPATEASPVPAVASPQPSTTPETARRTVVCPPMGRGDWRSGPGERRVRVRLHAPQGWDRLRQRVGDRGMGRGDQRGWSNPGWERRGTMPRMQRRAIVPRALGAASRVASVSAIDGTTVTLTTPDGWSRTMDTAGIPITRGEATIDASDLRVGDTVQVTQRRDTDGTWQVTGLRAVLATVLGTVSEVTDDGFQLTTRDGRTISVRVSETTTWVVGCRADPDARLETGSMVVARGVSSPDGSLEAELVSVSVATRRAPRSPHRLPAPVASPAPAVSPSA